jgi:hypothetical protein
MERRRQILAAALNSSAFERTDELPVAMRDRAWAVLRPLTTDPDPTPAVEERYGGSNMDPLTLSLNTARGAAMHAVMRYAIWIGEGARHGDVADTAATAGLTVMPEARDLLEAHLRPEVDPALAIRAVYGQWLPWLFRLDGEWTRGHLADILPPSSEQLAYWDAAWEAYLFYSQLFDDVFALLNEQYARAVAHCGEAIPARRRPADPSGRLGEHLMMMYWRGRLALENGGLVAEFFERAPAKSRGYALGFVGRLVRGTQEPVEQQVVARFVALWNDRVSRAEAASDRAGFLDELNAFGWWFTGGTFDPAWSVGELLRVLRLGAWPEPDHLVVEELAKRAETMTDAVVECLSILARADRAGWRIYGWGTHVRTILAAGLATMNPETREACRELINWLGGIRGLTEFRDLLNGRPAAARS